jgi:hypothetical protein
MAAVNGGYTTGANRDDGDLHRRNVTSYDKTNGSHVVKLEAEDTKKLQKVQHTPYLRRTAGLTFDAAATEHFTDLG